MDFPNVYVVAMLADPLRGWGKNGPVYTVGVYPSFPENLEIHAHLQICTWSTYFLVIFCIISAHVCTFTTPF